MLFAPLVGVILYLLLIEQFMHLGPGFLFLVLVGWFAALAITAMIGVPLGLAIALLLRQHSRESLLAYLASGVLLGALLPAMVGWFELILPASVTGLLLGAGYWQFEAKPSLEND